METVEQAQVSGVTISVLIIYTYMQGDVIAAPLDILNTIAEEINAQCIDCGFTNRTLTVGKLQCFSNNLNDTTFHGKLQATPEMTTTELLDLIEEWVRSGAANISYMGQTFTLNDNAASVGIEVSSQGVCMAVDHMGALPPTDPPTTQASTTQPPIETQRRTLDSIQSLTDKVGTQASSPFHRATITWTIICIVIFVMTVLV